MDPITPAASQPAYELPIVSVSGSPSELGEAVGESLRESCQGFVHERLRAARAYLYEHGDRDLDGLRTIAAACQDAAAAWDPDGHAEHLSLARAAGVPAVDLYLAANYTDLRDVHLYGRSQQGPADAEGCTLVAVPPGLSRDGQVIVGQTWDLNPGDLAFVVAIHRQPSDGPATWSVTCAGALSLIGMNAHGVVVGTTNIKARDVRIGVGYITILHRMLRTAHRQEALAILRAAPRAAAHTYLMADPSGADHCECSATQCLHRALAAEALVQTNHCQQAELTAIEAEAASSSSQARLARAREVLGTGAVDVPRLRDLFADRSAGVDSINRWPEDGTGTATDACLIAIPARCELHACRGPADRGRWLQLPFPHRTVPA